VSVVKVRQMNDDYIFLTIYHLIHSNNRIKGIVEVAGPSQPLVRQMRDQMRSDCKMKDGRRDIILIYLICKGCLESAHYLKTGKNKKRYLI